MDNEEKILSVLEALAGSVKRIESDIAEMKDDIAEMREDIEVLRDESAVTRGVTDQLLECWTERFGEPVPVPLLID